MEPAKTPKQRQREQEADHEQEHVKGHTDPLCLRWEKGELKGRIRGSAGVKRLGGKSELSTTCNAVPIARRCA